MVHLSQRLVLLRPKAASREAVIRSLGRCLAAAHCIRKGFTEAVLTHERDYPTGLAAGLPIALPHAEADFCRRAALALAILDPPVRFGLMAEKGEWVDARIVFMPTVSNLSSDIPWMGALAKLMRRREALEALASVPDRGQAVELLRSALTAEV